MGIISMAGVKLNLTGFSLFLQKSLNTYYQVKHSFKNKKVKIYLRYLIDI